jgi:predicted ribonuclease YlaK
MPDGSNSPQDAPLQNPSKEKAGSLVALPRVLLPKKKRPPEREVAEVGRLLGSRTHLVTLCGPGGCGKTRLA